MPLCVHMLLFSSIPAEPSIILSPSVLVFKKAHRQSANDFYFGEQELQASMKVSSANFANNGLCRLLFLTLNLQCTFVFLPNSNWFVKLHRDRYPFPFFSFSVAGCWDCVHGSPRSTTHRSTHQGWNRKRKVALSRWFSQPNAALIVYKKEKIAGSAKVMLKKCQNPAGVLLVNHHQPIVYEVTANLSLIWKGS